MHCKGGLLLLQANKLQRVAARWRSLLLLLLWEGHWHWDHGGIPPAWWRPGGVGKKQQEAGGMCIAREQEHEPRSKQEGE